MALVLVHQGQKRQSVLEEDEIEQLEGDFEEREVLRRHSNIGRMETAFDFYKSKAAGLMKEHDPDKIEQDAFKDIIRDAGKRFMGCLSLPFTFLFFILFAMSTILHADVKNAYLLESGLKQHLTAGVDSVETIGDAWAWMEGTMLPTFFPNMAETNHTNKDRWRPVLTYNRLIGPILISQIRSKKEACTREGFEDMTCYATDSRDVGTYGRATQDNGQPFVITAPDGNEYAGGTTDMAVREGFWKSAFTVVSERKKHLLSNAPAAASRLLREVSGEMGSYPPRPDADKETFTAMIFPNVLASTARDQMNYLKHRGWIDEQTISITITAVLLNAELGRPRLTQVKMDFLFSRAGGTFTVVDVNTIMLRFWQAAPGSLSFMADVVLVICLFMMALLQVKGITGDDPEKWRKCRSSWNLLQWAIVLSGWVCIGLHVITFLLTAALVPAYEGVFQAQQDDVPAESNDLGLDMHERINALTYFNGTIRFFFAMYHQLLILRFFTAFHAQPRLGVVTRTLEVSLIDILHFLVVLLPTFVAYAVSGCFIFGKRVEDFSDIFISIGTCFKIFMESEYDWPVLSEEYFVTPFLWVFSFMILLVMIMLNMVLAIVLDVYTEIRKKSGQSEPVWVTGFHMMQRIRHFRQWVSTQEILDKVAFMPYTISRTEIHEHFPKMCDEQVEQIFAAARYHSLASEQGNEKDARKLALAVKLVMDKITSTMQELDNGVCTSDSFDLGAQGWLPGLAREMATQNHMMLSLQWHLQQIEWQWQAMDVIHGHDSTFSGQHKLPPKEDTVL